MKYSPRIDPFTTKYVNTKISNVDLHVVDRTISVLFNNAWCIVLHISASDPLQVLLND